MEFLPEGYQVPRSTVETLESGLLKVNYELIYSQKVPIEEAKRYARQAQRILEKEWKPLKSNDPIKLELIQHKIEQARDAELEMLRLAERRQDYLDQLLNDGNGKEAWKQW